jgi:RIO kinase 1
LAIESAALSQLDEFFETGLVREVLSTIKSGKEATAYLVRGTKKLGEPFAVAKVYHDRNRRNFHDQVAYTEGRVILNGQVRRAVEKHTDAGREFEAGMWVNHEFEVLSALEYAGADVPVPYFSSDAAILMEYVSDLDGNPAIQLQHVHLERSAANALLERLLVNVELFLANNVVHGDLSAFNVLYAEDRWKVIDFPQSVDPRFSPHGRDLLTRDLGNLARYFARYGLEFDAEREAHSLWNRFRHGEL